MSSPTPFVLSVDLARWPIVLLTYAGTPTDDAVRAHLAEVEDKVLARRQPFVQIIDQTRGAPPDPIQRALIVDHQKRMRDAYAAYCLGEVYVAPPDVRGAMVAVFWMEQPPYPHAFVGNLAEALVWARARFRNHDDRAEGHPEQGAA